MSRLPILHFVCRVLSVSWLKRNPTYSIPRRYQHKPEEKPTSSSCLLHNLNKTWRVCNKEYFLKTLRRCESGLFPFKQPKFPFSSFLLYLNNVLISNCEVHWWLSDQRVRHETVCMRRISFVKQLQEIKCLQNSFGWSENNFSCKIDYINR